ncbi:MAG: UDP-N-acetylmuramoyl-L-alanyl-D-glutamate--2,6-diaminopimelate ligase [Clostridia bacterium]|nr:UDP-N-acetylmuramoyl-L-alanyl-D-glutamate--2,6-diaminopimelate ligase [Clostridia bacterium]
MKLTDIINEISPVAVYGNGDVQITSVTNNSRECKEGTLFVAVRGFQTDGHKYIASAIQNGAVAVICEEYNPDYDAVQIVVKNSRRAEAVAASVFYHNPSQKFRLVGITGTNGKTTVTYLTKHIFEQCGYKVGLIGTNQNMIGDEILETGRTTPDSIELQGIFAKMADSSVDFCIMEVSSHALELDRVYGCRYAVGAFTNLTQDHLDFHKTMDNYAAAKAKLWQMSDVAVINSDDAYGRQMIQNCGCDVISYAVKDKSANLRATELILRSSGIGFELDGLKFKLPIPGEFSVYNALCAIGIAKAAGIDESKIRDALFSASGVKGRAEVVPTDTDYTVIIDYAHTPDGIENILSAVRGFAEGRVVIVFGCGGDRDNTKRPIMGEIAGKMADFCVVTSDNPRTENPMKIIEMVEEGVKRSGAEYVVIESRREAIAYAMKNALPGDCIVLAGKGHETYQILNEGTIHFDEREVVREVLESM